MIWCAVRYSIKLCDAEPLRNVTAVKLFNWYKVKIFKPHQFSPCVSFSARTDVNKVPLTDLKSAFPKCIPISPLLCKNCAFFMNIHKLLKTNLHFLNTAV